MFSVCANWMMDKLRDWLRDEVYATWTHSHFVNMLFGSRVAQLNVLMVTEPVISLCVTSDKTPRAQTNVVRRPAYFSFLSHTGGSGASTTAPDKDVLMYVCSHDNG